MYALWVDEIPVARGEARAKLDEFLMRPFDAREAEEYDRDRWGMSPEQLQAQMATEALAQSATYG